MASRETEREAERDFYIIKENFKRTREISRFELERLKKALQHITIKTEEDYIFIDEITELLLLEGNQLLNADPEKRNEDWVKKQECYQVAYDISNSCSKKFMSDYRYIFSIKACYIRVEAFLNDVTISLSRDRNAPDSLEMLKNSLTLVEPMKDKILFELKTRAEWLLSEIHKGIRFLERKYVIENEIPEAQNIVAEPEVVVARAEGKGKPKKVEVQEPVTTVNAAEVVDAVETVEDPPKKRTRRARKETTEITGESQIIVGPESSKTTVIKTSKKAPGRNASEVSGENPVEVAEDKSEKPINGGSVMGEETKPGLDSLTLEELNYKIAELDNELQNGEGVALNPYKRLGVILKILALQYEKLDRLTRVLVAKQSELASLREIFNDEMAKAGLELIGGVDKLAGKEGELARQVDALEAEKNAALSEYEVKRKDAEDVLGRG